MSFVNNIWDFIKSVALIDETLQKTDAAVDSTNDKLARLVERFRKLERRVDRLEDALKAAKPHIDEVADLRDRISKLETARESDLALIKSSITQLSAERSRLDADVERHIAQIQRTNPQLPPTPTTDN